MDFIETMSDSNSLGQALSLLLAFTLIAVTAFFVAAEFSLVKVRATRFEEMARPLRNSKEMVSTMHGCIVSREALGDVIKDIKAGKYGS